MTTAARTGSGVIWRSGAGPSVALDVIEAPVGPSHEVVLIIRGFVRRDADGEGKVGRGRAEPSDDAVRVIGGAVGQDDCELVAAVAGKAIVGPQLGEPRGWKPDQHLVAGLVTEFVVDPLEVVEIDDGDTQWSQRPVRA